MSALSRPEFHSEEAAFAHLEKIVCGLASRCARIAAEWTGSRR